MPLLLDTYNILHVTGVLPPDLAGIDVSGLLDLLAGSRFRAEQAVLVCDGTPPRGGSDRSHRIAAHRVLFSGAHESADDVIRRMIAHSSAPRRLTVVSSDHEIIRAARTRRCQTMTSDKLLELLAEDHARPRARRATSGVSRKPRAPLSAASVDEWIKVFGLNKGDLDIPSSHQ